MSKLISSIPEQIIVKLKNSEKMKKLTGMKKSLSSLENKRLKTLNITQGGNKAIPSNLVNENGSRDTDYYDDNGNWISRGWCCNG